jgi:hypothetical protein
VVAPGLPDDGGAAVARAVGQSVGGVPAQAWMLDGLAVRAAGSWWGRPLERWVARLTRAGIVPSLADLLAPDAERRLGEHVVVPLRGFLMGHLVETLGLPAVRALWRDATRDLPADLARTFAAALDANYAQLSGDLAAADDARRAAVLAEPFLGGVALVEARHDTRGGYGSLAADAAVARAAANGARAVSLTVFAYADERPRRRPGTHAPGLGASAGDTALASSVAAARARGMRVLLTPHHLAASNATWADAQALTTPDEQARFFEQHARVTRHYALLAELLGVEWLAVGTELRVVSATRADEEDAFSAGLLAEWTALIAGLDGAFGGALLYDAGWPGEAHAIGFWPALDAVGVHYFPEFDAAPDDAAIARRLESDLGSAAAFARELGKPLVVTQVGFPSCARAWRDTGTVSGGRDTDVQRRLYAGLVAALDRLHARGSAPAAMFLWRYATDAAGITESDRGHALQGKPAEALVPELLGER